MTQQQYTLKGINSDTETCECCGKTGLKRVMWLESLDSEGNGTGTVTPMGTTCGARALGFKGEFSSIEQVAEAVQMRNKKEEVIKQAQEMAKEFGDEIAIIRNGNNYYTVRGRAFDANPSGYNTPIQWVS